MERHFLESELQLRHINELIARADVVRTERTVPQEIEARLTQFKHDRDRYAQELRDYRTQPVRDAATAAKRGAGLKGVFETMGVELEKALTAIFERDIR